MRPEAHIAAAIDILDAVLKGQPAEKSLTNWARGHRFAGSSDRAAIRDIVFDALRRRRSYAWMGGAETGRGLMLGRLVGLGETPTRVFTGEGYGPAAITADEQASLRELDDAPDAVRLDCPDWLLPILQDDLGGRAKDILTVLQDRAPVFLRVNLARTDRTHAVGKLAEDGIEAIPHDLSQSALAVVSGERRVRNSKAFGTGLVELQDAASQAVVDACLPYLGSGEVLDFCAGGGGKALAFAGAGVPNIAAHDINFGRMADIPDRSKRAGAQIRLLKDVRGEFDFVLCDAPCSGSGAWRRQPEAKWALDQARLAVLNDMQDAVLKQAMSHVRVGGHLGYATCSILKAENDARVSAFLSKNPDWSEVCRKDWTPLDGGDGFFLSIMRNN